MTKGQLVPHPRSSVQAIDAVAAEWQRDKAELRLRYRVDARLGNLVLPNPAQPVRADNLWQTTCFEMFARLPGEAGYAEFNFSPSSQWAAYAFAGYRDLRGNIPLAAAPAIHLDAGAENCTVEVRLILPDPWAYAPLELALSAVIEHVDGTKSYWALAHPPGAPDFHHHDCFALHLAAPDAA